MADVTDPAGRTGIPEEDSAGHLRVAMSTRQCAGHVVVALSGELDLSDAAAIGALVTTIAIRVPWLIVDLAGLTFTDCAGMRALADAAWQARQAGGVLVLAAPSPPVMRVLDLTGLMAGVPVYGNVDDAAGVASQQRAARPVREPEAPVLAAGLPVVRRGRQQEEGQRDRHPQPTAADTRPVRW